MYLCGIKIKTSSERLCYSLQVMSSDNTSIMMTCIFCEQALINKKTRIWIQDTESSSSSADTSVKPGWYVHAECLQQIDPHHTSRVSDLVESSWFISSTSAPPVSLPPPRPSSSSSPSLSGRILCISILHHCIDQSSYSIQSSTYPSSLLSIVSFGLKDAKNNAFTYYPT